MSRSPDPAVRSAWQARLHRYEHSQFTVAEFCRREGVSAASFYRWRKKLSDHTAKPPRATERTDARFVPLLIAGSAASDAKLQLPGGAVLELPASLQREQLTELFAACIAAASKAAEAQQ